jgi:transposase
MSEFTIKLDIPSLKILEQKLDIKGNIVLTVESTENKSVCHKCGKDATKYYGYAPSIQVRHLSILVTPVYLNIRPIRYQCEHCDDHTTTEQYESVASALELIEQAAVPTIRFGKVKWDGGEAWRANYMAITDANREALRLAGIENRRSRLEQIEKGEKR